MKPKCDTNAASLPENKEKNRYSVVNIIMNKIIKDIIVSLMLFRLEYYDVYSLSKDEWVDIHFFYCKDKII